MPDSHTHISIYIPIKVNIHFITPPTEVHCGGDAKVSIVPRIHYQITATPTNGRDCMTNSSIHETNGNTTQTKCTEHRPKSSTFTLHLNKSATKTAKHPLLHPPPRPYYDRIDHQSDIPPQVALRHHIVSEKQSISQRPYTRTTNSTQKDKHPLQKESPHSKVKPPTPEGKRASVPRKPLNEAHRAFRHIHQRGKAHLPSPHPHKTQPTALSLRDGP